MGLYGEPFMIALAVSIILHALILRGSRQFSFLRGNMARSARHEKRQAQSRVGGIAIAGAFTIAILCDQNLIVQGSVMWAFFCGGWAMLLLGVWDDYKKLPWFVQLGGQVSIIASVFMYGLHIDFISLPFIGAISLVTYGISISLFATIIWVLLSVNAFNWSDGIDGVSGGVALIAAATIFLITLLPEVHQPPVGIITAAFCGAVLGFLFFNFYPAKIFAGTGGSFFMGFTLATLALFAGAKIATMLLVLAVPIVDAAWVIVQRLRSGVSIFHSDRRHIHHNLLALGMSHRTIALSYYCITIFIAFLALQTKLLGKFYVIIGVFSVVALLVASISYYAAKK